MSGSRVYVSRSQVYPGPWYTRLPSTCHKSLRASESPGTSRPIAEAASRLVQRRPSTKARFGRSTHHPGPGRILGPGRLDFKASAPLDDWTLKSTGALTHFRERFRSGEKSQGHSDKRPTSEHATIAMKCAQGGGDVSRMLGFACDPSRKRNHKIVTEKRRCYTTPLLRANLRERKW